LSKGYRVYTKNGNKIDETEPEKGKYIGWSKKFDEEINVTSPRIAQRDTMAKKFY